MKNLLFTVCLIINAGLYAQTTHTINTGSFYYNPDSLSINVGDSVIWINDGGNHDVNGDISSITSQPYNNPVTFDSPATNIVGAIIFGYKFTVSGTYNYDCSVYGHASQGMVGVINVQEDTILSIKQKTNFVNIRPNPTKENITISIENFNGNIQTEVYDLIGNKLQSNNETTISLQDCANGIYLLKVNYGDRVQEVKVIKE
jgi:plastocyanin